MENSCLVFVSNTVGSGACSDVRILAGFFVGNISLLKLFRIFSFALGNNPVSLEKTFFQLVFYLYPYALIQWLTGLVLYRYLLMTNFPCVYLLEKQ